MESLQDRLQREARDKYGRAVAKNAMGYEEIEDIISHTISETIKAERAEWLRSEIEELEKRKFNVVDWLRNTYGLDDDDCLSAGRVQELCEMLVPDAFTSIITRYKEELKVLTGEYE